MKLTCVLLVTACLQVSASAYSQKITLAEKNASLEKVFRKIMKQSDYMFLYNHELLMKAKNVSIDVKAASIDNVLNECFNGQPVTYTIFEKTVVVSPRNNSTKFVAPLPPVIVRGRVLDENNQPLPGASVSLKSANVGVITNSSGQFSITVPEESMTGGVLVFNFLGYQQQEVVISSRTDISVTLKPTSQSLNEVVVVGYGTQKRANITGAMSTFNAGNLEERPVVRADQALVGQLAGVTVKQTNTVPGKGFSIQVRGTGSIGAGNEPLYVIDGFPLATASPNGTGSFGNGNPLDNINPNDIESIQVLKDASSAAIYGSRASNGVVLITTKKGKTGKPKITFNTTLGYSEPVRKLDVLSSEEWIERATEMINSQWVASAAGRTASQTNEQRRVALGLPVGGVNATLMTDDRWYQPGHPGLYFIDWQDEIFRKGLTQNYQVAASGGTDNVSYYVSGNMANQEGIVKGLDYKAYSGRANVEVKANANLKFGLNISPTYSQTNDPGGVEGKESVAHHAYSLAPVMQSPAGSVNVGTSDKYAWSGSFNDPLYRLENIIGLTTRFRTLSTLFGELTLAKGLMLKSTLNLDNTDNTTKSYVPFTAVAASAGARAAALTTNTSGTFTGLRKRTFVNENTLNYNFSLKSSHNFSLLAGASYNSDKIETSRLSSVGGYTSSVITTLSAAAGISGNTFETKNVLISTFGRLQYDYKSKYLLTASLRRDGSSRFGENNKYGWFPAASLGWRITEENFMKSLPQVSDLKFRVSYGEAGNYNIPDYAAPTLSTTLPTVFNNAQVTGVAPNKIGNPDLIWEQSKTLDFGLDFGILKNRITGSFDIYTRDNENLLLNSPTLATTGFSSFLNNAGKVRNKGWEVELTSRNVTGNFEWSTSLNLSHNSNKVISLTEGQTQTLIPSAFDISHSILRVGEPIYSIFVVKEIGVLSEQDIDNKVAMLGGPGKQSLGDAKYFDYDGNGVIDQNDRVIVGHPNPDYTWGITNSFKYKSFDLSFLVQGQNGGSIYSLLGRALDRTGQTYNDNMVGANRNRWRSPENPGDGKSPKSSSLSQRIKNTDWLYSSDYYRVRNITLGYNLGQSLKIKSIQGARVYITAENFFGHDKYTGGANPEAVNTDVSNSTQYPEAGDYGGLPLPKSLVLGLNFTF